MRRVGASVYGVANGNTEDVVQEAVARAIKSGVSLEAEQWLRTVAKRVAIDQHRRRHETPSGAPTDLERWSPKAPGTTDGDPEESYIRAERSQAVREALAALPPRYQKALLAYAEEDCPAAVANRLGLSAAATWTLLSRARSRLKLQLEQSGFVPAMLMGGSGRPRLRAIFAAGAVAATAATAVIVPRSNDAKAVKPEVPVAVAVDVAAPAEVKPAKKDAAPASHLPTVEPDAVKGKVDDVVEDVQSKDVTVKVAPCLGPDDERLALLELSIVEEKRPALAKLIGAVPAPLRDPLALTC
jgi:RNA polymerase sigma factor (sigma-70 family)